MSETGIHRALETAVFDELLPRYANKFLFTGFDRNSNLIEILYNIRNNESRAIVNGRSGDRYCSGEELFDKEDKVSGVTGT